MQTSVSAKRRKELSVGSGDEVVDMGRGTGRLGGGGGRQERGLEVQDHGISSGFSYHMNIGLYNDYIVLHYGYSLRYRLHQEFVQTVTAFDADDTEPLKDVSRFGLPVRR